MNYCACYGWNHCTCGNKRHQKRLHDSDGCKESSDGKGCIACAVKICCSLEYGLLLCVRCGNEVEVDILRMESIL